jgi:PilZ domain
MDRDSNAGTSAGMPASEADVRKRRYPRFAADFPVQVRLTTQGPTKPVACEGQGTNISGGGLAVRADIELPVGTQVGVEFTPPYSDEPMAFRCFIRNRNGNLYGVEFITENDEDYRKAGELLAGLAAMNAAVSAV